MERDRTELTKALVRAGLRNATGGAEAMHGIGDGASAGKSAQLRQSADREGDNQPMGMRQGTIRRTSVPFLMLIKGGKR